MAGPDTELRSFTVTAGGGAIEIVAVNDLHLGANCRVSVDGADGRSAPDGTARAQCPCPAGGAHGIPLGIQGRRASRLLAHVLHSQYFY